MKAHVADRKIKISVCSIVKNEESVIARCINSYKDYVDEIVIADTGSTDRTPEIAESLGAKVLHFDWCGDFSKARNFALDAVTGDWIINIDADQYFVGDSASRVAEAALAAESRGYNAIGCREENVNTKTGKLFADIYVVKIYKKGIRYRYPIHEEPFREDGIEIIDADKSWFYFRHTGYSNEIQAKKAKRDLALLKKEYLSEKSPRRKVCCLSYMSDAYISIGNYRKSISAAQRYLDEQKKYGPVLIGCETSPYINIIQSLEQSGGSEKRIMGWLDRMGRYYSASADYKFLSAKSCLRRGMYGDAKKLFTEALSESENITGSLMNMAAGKKAEMKQFIGLASEGLMDKAGAMEWYYRSLSDTSKEGPALFSMILIAKCGPEAAFDTFVESLYLNEDKKRIESVLLCLMSGYMTKQLIKCYAYYRKKYGCVFYDANITAAIMAGMGKYDKSAKLYYMDYKENGSGVSLMRAALFSGLAGDEGFPEDCPPEYEAVIKGVPMKAGKPNIENIISLINETFHLGRDQDAERFALNACGLFSARQIVKISEKLMDSGIYGPAFAMLKCVPVTGKAVFMRAVCLYHMKRFFEAEDMFGLSLRLGYDNKASEYLGSLSRKFAVRAPEKGRQEIKNMILNSLESGKYAEAAGFTEEYVRLWGGNENIYSARIFSFFCGGDIVDAGIAARIGLNRFPDSVDINFNAGCVFEKEGKKAQAEKKYRKALKLSRGGPGTADIKKAIENVMAGKIV